jgi:nucleotide-binding universal stress UspA family protein
VAETILRAADAMAADLVAVGTHGAGAVERLILGSVADKVIRGAGRPVLVVPVA